MKIRLIAITAALLALLPGCKKINPENGGSPEGPSGSIKASVSSLEFTSKGGSLSFDIEAGVSWKITVSTPWVWADITSGSGKATVTLTAEANTSGRSRTANVFIQGADAYAVVKVTQREPLATDLEYLGCYEIPQLDLFDAISYSGRGREKWGSANWYSYNTNNENQRVITHTFPYNDKIYRNNTILLDKTKKAALWNAFVMHKEVYSKDEGVGRSGSWTMDPAVSEDWQSCFATEDYSRGHQMASNYRQVNDEANKQTFYYTNQALQWQNSFNAGVWSSLELAVAANAPSGRDTLYVVVGLLYENETLVQNVPLPSHFYKCLMKCGFDDTGKMVDARGAAYIFTNEAHGGMTFQEAITSIDAVESRAGFNFFANVPVPLQDKAESQTEQLW